MKVFAVFLPFVFQTVTSFDLQCNYANSPYEMLGVMSNCIVQSLTITNPNKTITSVNYGMSPTDFQGLYMYGMTVEYLPRGIAKFFPQLRALQLNNCGLKSIKAADLEGLSNLEGLLIHSNAIETISSDLLKFTPNVVDFFFHGNKISHVGEDLFKNFHNFKRITFTENECIDSEATSDFEDFKEELQIKCPNPIEENDAAYTDLFSSDEIEEMNLQSFIMALGISQFNDRAEYKDLDAENSEEQDDNDYSIFETTQRNDEVEQSTADDVVDASEEDDESEKIKQLRSENAEMERRISTLETEIRNLKAVWEIKFLELSTKLLLDETIKLTEDISTENLEEDEAEDLEDLLIIR